MAGPSPDCRRAFAITKAQDDAAGLAIAVNLGAQIQSYNQSVRNANDALNVVQTADSVAQRDAEHPDPSARAGLAVGVVGRQQHRARLHPERGRRRSISEIDRIANATEYNGVALLNATAALTFQVGIRNVAANDQIVVTTTSATVPTLALSARCRCRR